MRRWLRDLERFEVVVHTKDDQSIRGVLMEAKNDQLMLTDARYLGEDSTSALAGDVVVLRENVSWLQRLPAGEG